MNKKKIMMLSIVILALVILVVVLLISSNNKFEENGKLNNDPLSGISGELDSSQSESLEAFVEVNNLSPIIAEAPREDILENSNQPLKIVNLTISENGFSPKEFKVKTGQVITLNLGVLDENTHAFNFSDIELLASNVLVTPGYSLGFNIVAPLEAGTYNFFDANFPENTGRMIVE